MIQRAGNTSGSLQLTFTAGDDGSAKAAYITLGNTSVFRTEEIKGDILLADFDEEDRLVGIEILGPIQVKDILSLVDAGQQGQLERLIKRHFPAEFIERT